MIMLKAKIAAASTKGERLWMPDVQDWVYVNNLGGKPFFLRLRTFDTSSLNPALADFDGDGIANQSELDNATDPLSNLDTDADGLPDD